MKNILKKSAFDNKYLQMTCPDYRNDNICANLPSTLKKINLIFEACSFNDSNADIYYQNESNRLKIPQNCKVTVREFVNMLIIFFTESIFFHKNVVGQNTKEYFIKFCGIIRNFSNFMNG